MVIDPYPCPRCGERTLQEYYAPCESCRTELKDAAAQQRAWRAFTNWWTNTRPSEEWKYRMSKDTDD